MTIGVTGGSLRRIRGLDEFAGGLHHLAGLPVGLSLGRDLRVALRVLVVDIGECPATECEDEGGCGDAGDDLRLRRGEEAGTLRRGLTDTGVGTGVATGVSLNWIGLSLGQAGLGQIGLGRIGLGRVGHGGWFLSGWLVGGLLRCI
ncbi:hypothetical protein GCG21_13690 [Pseudactinotalea sp. HY160]|nr:hypothetical protein [Pseudactinotalea sp. HY160]